MSRRDYDNRVHKNSREDLEGGGNNNAKLNPDDTLRQPQSMQFGGVCQPGYSSMPPQHRLMFKINSLDKESFVTPAFKMRQQSALINKNDVEAASQGSMTRRNQILSRGFLQAGSSFHFGQPRVCLQINKTYSHNKRKRRRRFLRSQTSSPKANRSITYTCRTRQRG